MRMVLTEEDGRYVVSVTVDPDLPPSVALFVSREEAEDYRRSVARGEISVSQEEKKVPRRGGRRSKSNASSD